LNVPLIHRIVFPTLSLGIGLGVYVAGFRSLARKRLIENTPASKIRSMAMGLVEIHGTAVDWHALKGPFTLESCVYYKWQVEEYQQRGKNSEWVVVRHGDSSAAPFYLQDDTGKALVRPNDAEVVIAHDFQLKTGLFSEIPTHIGDFLAAQNYNDRAFFGLNKTLRFTEWNIQPGEAVFLLGSCLSNSDHLLKERRDRLQEAFRKIKDDPQAMSRFDSNQDGQISADEWEVARQSIEKSLPPEPEGEDLYLGMDPLVGKTLLLSDKSEKGLVSRYFWQALAGYVFGTALTAAGAWLAYQFWSN